MYSCYDRDCRQGSCDSLSHAEDWKGVSAGTDVRLWNNDEIMSCDRAFLLIPPATWIVLSVGCFIMAVIHDCDCAVT